VSYRPKDGIWSERAIDRAWARFGPEEARRPVRAVSDCWSGHRLVGERFAPLPSADEQARRMR
jgi:hypothetical protein